MEQNNMTRLCRNCGAPLNSGEKFCASCGSPVDQQNPYQQSGYQPNYYPQFSDGTIHPAAIRNMSKQEYRKVCKNKKYLSRIKTAAMLYR